MGFMLGLKAFTAAVMGGISNLWGAMVGGLISVWSRTWDSSSCVATTGTSFAFVVLVLVLIFPSRRGADRRACCRGA